MVPNYKKIEALKVVINGGTLSEAGLAMGVSSTRARDHISRICREFGLSNNVKYIRSNPDEYLSKIETFKDEPKAVLRNALIYKLVTVLRLKNDSELTPEYLSNINASQLMKEGITSIAIVEIQEWLSHTKSSLKISPPQTEDDIKKVRQALSILNVFQFDTKKASEQLAYFTATSS